MGGEGLDECNQKNDGDCSGDDSCKESERPLKKARYSWEVKGKNHLKEAVEGQDEDTTAMDELSANTDKHSSANSLNGSCCLKTLLNISNSLMSDDSSDDECFSNKNTNRGPVSLVKLAPKNQDYYLNKWQEKQLARGYLDNTVNEVIEKWRPLVPSINVDSIIEDCDSDGIVEDEGILMAIQSHGLQSTPTQGPFYPSEVNDTRECLPFVSTQELAVSALDNIQNAQNELLKAKTHEEESFVDFEMGFLDAAVAAAIEKKGLTSQSF